MKQKLLFSLLLCTGMQVHPGMAVHGQTASVSCLYVIDADLQKTCLTPDTLPEPQEGMNELFRRLAVEVSLPTVEGYEIAGTQTVIRFIVDESGSISGKMVLKKQFYDCDVAEQMFTIVQSMTWKPAYCDGKPVPSEFILPLRMYVN